MTELSYLIVRLIEYQVRYETETYNPELHDLLTQTIKYLKHVAEGLDYMKDLLKQGRLK